MNTLKKMLVTATMVVTLGATTSCGNKDNQPNFVGGLPYTLFTVSRLYTGDTYTIRFECDGNPEVYWNSETPNHEKSHVFTYNPDQPGSEPIVLIKGDIDNLRFCDGNGNLLEEDNAHILTVVFSNKIKKLPEYACYSLWSSQNNNDSYSGKTVYLPASIKTIGKNAFFPRNEKNLSHFICEPTSRPSGWDPNWCTIGELARFMSWGFSYYITDNYDMYYIVNDNPIITACYEGNLRYDVTDLVIPETINVNGFECSVVGIKRVGNSGGVLKSVTIPKSIMFIDSKAFKGCRDLKEVEFADEYDYLFFGDFIFGFCDSLKSIVLPKGLVNLSDGMFQGANSLTSVKVPNTVRSVAGDIFYGCSQDITVDLTSYQSADSIAECNNEMLDDYSGTITFKIKNGLTEEEFVAKGWPKADGSGTPTVVWETVSTLNA